MKTDVAATAREGSTGRCDQSDLADLLQEYRQPDLEVDGWEPSLLQRLLKYLDPNNK